MRTATCACGSFSISVEGEPQVHAVCHCDNCKRRTGSAFGVSAYYRKDSIVRIEGENTCYALRAKRGDDQERFFCAKCGTTLYWHLSTWPNLVGIASGCFADALTDEPTLSASTTRKWPWITVPAHWRRNDD